jgi:hypothetical protein
MVNKDTPISIVKDLMKYDGIYYKITKHEIECGCFCSAGDCVEEFDTIGEMVIMTYGNLFHVKCFGVGHKIKKPRYINMSKYR